MAKENMPRNRTVMAIHTPDGKSLNLKFMKDRFLSIYLYARMKMSKIALYNGNSYERKAEDMKKRRLAWGYLFAGKPAASQAEKPPVILMICLKPSSSMISRAAALRAPEPQ